MSASDSNATKETTPSPPPRNRVRGVTYWCVLALGVVGLAMTINQVFGWGVFGFRPLGNAFLYYIIGIFLASAFLSYPVRDADYVPWYDWMAAAGALVSTAYLGFHGLQIITEGWEFSAPISAMIASSALLLLVLEGVRRCGGWPLLFTALIFGAYPLYADFMPGFLWGNSFAPGETVRAHVMGMESITGVPMQVVANLIIGFVLFGVALTITGGGKFFMDFASAMMGRSRGGPAKVAVISSGFMGSLSGSAISNVLTTGAITIPTMKRTGYPAHYAGAVEACASTGGALMPPVMGAVAFIMASFLGVPYATVMVAAFLPALMFYLALLLQVDNYAARNGLKGMEEKDIPKLSETLKDGWPYLFALAMLIYMLLVMRLEAYAPYYATAVLLVIALFRIRRRSRMKVSRLLDLMLELSRSVGNLVAILAGIGLVVGGLSYTGVASAFSGELLYYAGGSVPLILIAGAVTSFVLGMGMTASAVYIFLSILMVPGLVEAGLNPLASHLFILYWGMMSYITPPVALASITAAGIAQSDPSRTGLYAMRLGSILFILPFLFVLNPLLILQGPVGQVILAATTALIAVWLLASTLEGYLYQIGNIGWPTRIILLAPAAGLVTPGQITDLIAVVILAAVYATHLLLLSGRKHEKAAMSIELSSEGKSNL